MISCVAKKDLVASLCELYGHGSSSRFVLGQHTLSSLRFPSAIVIHLLHHLEILLHRACIGPYSRRPTQPEDTLKDQDGEPTICNPHHKDYAAFHRRYGTIGHNIHKGQCTEAVKHRPKGSSSFYEFHRHARRYEQPKATYTYL